jgi:hypothetical protein
MDFSDSEQSEISLDAEKDIVDCTVCDFTFQQANFVAPSQFTYASVEFGDFQAKSPLLLRTKQQVNNQSLRGPPRSNKS